jgi:alpha-1,6-mannosyltransferase
VAWTLVGLGGSLLLTLAGSRLGGGTVTWWFDPRVGSTRETQRLFFYVGVSLLIVAWLGLGPFARSQRMSDRHLWLITALWCLPLVLGAPLFSRDVYSYLAQGTIAHLGLSPYHAAPTVLARLGHGHVMSAVDPFWRRQTAPYGPLFVGVISLIAGLTGSQLVAGVLLIRAFDLIGLVLLAVAVPRLARSMGGDPTRALWLTVAGPLVLLQLVAPAHNDLLMAGLMAAGVCLAVDRHPVPGLVLCALAATVKLPAIVAAAFVAVVWVRSETTWRRRALRAGQSAAVTIATLAAVTLATGFGTGWISSGLFSTPARVHLATTPATDLSWTIARLLGDLGARVGFHSVDSVLRVALFVIVVMIAVVLLKRSQRGTMLPYLGLVLIAFAIGGPALWPWYLSWGLVLLAGWPPAQRSWLVIVGLVIASLLVQPGGVLALPLSSSPVVAGAWVALALAFFYRRRRRQRLGFTHDRAGGLGSARSVLVER